jgi:arylsulfatase A-like enzyme
MPNAKNVLFICVDQWRGDSLGILGHPASLTPNIDALARDGVLFRAHYGQAAPCGPARASMLTGQYVMNHRVVANGIPLDARHPNLATEVRRIGMEPAMIGYTTTIPDPVKHPPGDPRFSEIGDVMEGWQIFAHFDEVDFRNYFGWITGRGVPLPADPFAVWYPAEGPCGPSASPSVITAAHSDTAWTGEHGLAFLRATRVTRPGRPWLLHLGFYRPHPPFIAPAPYHAMVADAAIPPAQGAASAAEEAAQHPVLAHWMATQKQASYYEGASGRVADLTEREILLTRRAYYGLIAEIDDWVGRVLAELRASGQWDDTLIVFTSDHGEQLGDHRLLGKLGWFDQSYHLPLIVRDPGGVRGRIVDAFTESVDLMPTILDWLGQPAPPSCDGVSLMPWLRGETPARWRDAVHFEYDLRGGWPEPQTLPDGTPPEAGPMAALRTRDWKYVHMPGLPPVLYDLRADPGETRNVAADPAHRALLLEATARMLSWRMTHEEAGHSHLVATPNGLAARHTPRTG